MDRSWMDIVEDRFNRKEYKDGVKTFMVAAEKCKTVQTE